MTNTTNANNSSSELAETERLSIVNAAGQIVAAYVSKNEVNKDDLPTIIAATIDALERRIPGQQDGRAVCKTNIDPNKTVFPDHIISLEDGKPYKTLKRHLGKFGMTPDDYRHKWGLPSDYPMVCENYSKVRSKMAKDIGLGSSRALRAVA